MTKELREKISDAMFSYLGTQLITTTPKGEKVTLEWEGNTIVLKADGKDCNPFSECIVSTYDNETHYNGKTFSHCMDEFVCQGFIAKAETEDDFMKQDGIIPKWVDDELVLN